MSYHCENCPFKDSKCMKPQPVINKGGLFIIGESPGLQEIAKQRPFVGPAGEVLRKTFATVGVKSLDDAHLTTALLCAPPKGKADNKTAVRSCAVRLHRELREAKPSMILALGNVSLHAVTDDFDLKITREQGKLF